MDYAVINLHEKLAGFSDHWAPKIIARVNDYHFKLAKFKGDFVWHSHDDTDGREPGTVRANDSMFRLN